MNKKSPEGTDDDTKAILEIAESQVKRVMRELDDVIAEIEAGQHQDKDKAKATAIDLRKAIQSLFDERNRLAKLDDTGANAARDTDLDLDAARAEIGRRLSSLRKQGPHCRVLRGPD